MTNDFSCLRGGYVVPPLRVALVTVVLFLGATAAGAGDCTITNTDIAKMADAGLSDDLIVAAMSRCAGQFDLSPDAIIALKAHKVSDAVVARMQQPAAPAAETAPAAPGATNHGAGAPAAPPTEPEGSNLEELGMYIAVQSGDILKMKTIVTTTKGSGGRVAADVLVPFAGFARHKHKTTVPGLKAETRYKSGDIKWFLYYASPGAPVDAQTLHLVKAVPMLGKDFRELSATLSAVTGGQQQQESGIPWTVKVTKVPGLYKMIPDTPLPPGEYAVLSGQFGQERTFGIKDAWDFGID
jgi:hypothetical protein